MNTPRLIFAYSVIVVFVVFSIIGAFGALGWIGLAPTTTQVTIISACLGIVVAILKAHSLFHDPESTAKLKDDHADVIRTMKTGHADVIAERVTAERETEAKHRAEVSKLNAEIAGLKSKLAEEHKRLTEAWKKIPPANARPVGYMPSSGSAHTSTPIPPPKE